MKELNNKDLLNDYEKSKNENRKNIDTEITPSLEKITEDYYANKHDKDKLETNKEKDTEIGKSLMAMNKDFYN